MPAGVLVVGAGREGASIMGWMDEHDSIGQMEGRQTMCWIAVAYSESTTSGRRYLTSQRTWSLAWILDSNSLRSTFVRHHPLTID